VDAFLDKIRSEQVREDCRTIAGMMQDVTRAKPKLWGPSIVGFGQRTVTYADAARRNSWPSRSRPGRQTSRAALPFYESVLGFRVMLVLWLKLGPAPKFADTNVAPPLAH